MTQPRSVVRRRRSAASVGVTGASGALGSALVARLTADAAGLAVIALDSVGVSRLEGIEVLVHLATDRSATTPAEARRAVNVRATELVLDAAAAAGVRRVVVLSSAMVYGASAHNSVPLPEDTPLIDEPDSGLVADWVAVERLASARGRGAAVPEITVIRPASLVGAVSDALLPGLFEAVRLLGIRDAHCAWQFCHTDDLLDAVLAAVRGEVGGIVTVGSDGSLSRREVEEISGLRTVVVPASVAFATASRLHRVGALASPASDLRYLMHPWVIGSQQLRSTGWVPRWTNEAALRDHLDRLGDRTGRSLVVVDRKDATRAAATLAVVGSLALARARVRRR